MYPVILLVTILLGPNAEDIKTTTQGFSNMEACQAARGFIEQWYELRIVPQARKQNGLRPYLKTECVPFRRTT